MQVEGFFFKRRKPLALALSSTFLLIAFSGCTHAPSPDVMATVNSKDISRSDLDKAYNNYKATQGETPDEPSPEQANIVRLNVLRQLIDEEILDQRASKLNLAASDEDVNAKLTELKAPYTQEEFDKKLKQQSMTLDDLKLQIRRQLTSTKLINKEIESKINITDADIAAYYNSHKALYNVIEPNYHLGWIVVTTGQQQPGVPNAHPTSDADARKKIQTVRNSLTTGQDFGALAMNASEDPNTNSNAGDMGFIAESQLQQRDPAAFAAITKLKPGQVTDVLPVYGGAGPAQHAVGYAIYKLISREPAGQRELNNPSVQQSIRQGLRESHAQLLRQAYLEMLRDDAKVRNYFAEQILKQGAK
ncbi:SurA N-terminal domain-containing protein [Occallatibacter savannae]|uniref:SurA N-terminal domain-containing protein n=1 Tax=Occallatibacter savannae TaxID=1002691 RepID=UPI001EF5B40F|nr:SurA N-terminal domain-containing protein [Occallatibacter savannae]